PRPRAWRRDAGCSGTGRGHQEHRAHVGRRRPLRQRWNVDASAGGPGRRGGTDRRESGLYRRDPTIGGDGRVSRACLPYVRGFCLEGCGMAITTASRDRALSDEQWERIEPLLPSNEGRKGHPFENNRMIVDGIIYRARTGIPWRDLPRERFGPWQTV